MEAALEAEFSEIESNMQIEDASDVMTDTSTEI